MLTLKISYPGNYCSPEVDEQFRELINQQCNYESFDTEFGFGNREIVVGIGSIEEAVKLHRLLSSDRWSARFSFVFDCECPDLRNYMQCCECDYWWNAYKEWNEENVCPRCHSGDIGRLG